MHSILLHNPNALCLSFSLNLTRTHLLQKVSSYIVLKQIITAFRFNGKNEKVGNTLLIRKNIATLKINWFFLVNWARDCQTSRKHIYTDNQSKQAFVIESIEQSTPIIYFYLT